MSGASIRLNLFAQVLHFRDPSHCEVWIQKTAGHCDQFISTPTLPHPPSNVVPLCAKSHLSNLQGYRLLVLMFGLHIHAQSQARRTDLHLTSSHRPHRTRWQAGGSSSRVAMGRQISAGLYTRTLEEVVDVVCPSPPPAASVYQCLVVSTPPPQPRQDRTVAEPAGSTRGGPSHLNCHPTVRDVPIPFFSFPRIGQYRVPIRHQRVKNTSILLCFNSCILLTPNGCDMIAMFDSHNGKRTYINYF
ncbi:hypothetical protein EPR50_G00069920 [Perca flavescens]|uniref:Uncharacterized protein n=1 Tax=Perca flavescens TaxID=8167 RepID=A0A484DCA4_PERFV|nr:hypothetical protein EPR50_G00069920 [Perca flavescens]